MMYHCHCLLIYTSSQITSNYIFNFLEGVYIILALIYFFGCNTVMSLV